jgi:hypothetical protein
MWIETKLLTLGKKGNEGWHWMLNKPILIVETNNHIKTLIMYQIFAFVAVKTQIVVMPLNESNVLCMLL